MSLSVTTELLDGCVLAILTKEDLYGYALTQKVQASLPVSESTMYPVLRRLKNKKWLAAYDEAFDGRNRRYYKITADGTTRLNEIRNDWESFRDTMNDILGGAENGN